MSRRLVADMVAEITDVGAGLAACGLSTTVLWWDTDGGGHPRPGPGVAVLPVTHSAPDKSVAALEISPAVKRHLKLDAEG